MPIVLVRYKREYITDSLLVDLANFLPGAVSNALDVPNNEGARLRPSDIEVSLIQHGEFDVNVKPLEIIIFAHQFPERQQNIDERVKIISDMVKEFLAIRRPNIRGFVWVLLQPTGFSEF